MVSGSESGPRSRRVSRRTGSPAAEAHRAAVGAERIEDVRLGESARVTVRGPDQGHPVIIVGDFDSADLRLAALTAGQLNRRVVAQYFLDKCPGRHGTRPDRGTGSRIPQDDLQPVAEQVGGGL